MDKNSSTKHIIVGPGAIGLSLFSILSRKAETYLISNKEGNPAPELPIIVSGAIQHRLSIKEHLIERKDLKHLEGPLYVWLTVKAYDLISCVKDLRDYLPQESTLVICSNGLNLSMDIANLIDFDQRLVRCLFSFGALMSSPVELVVSGAPSALVATANMSSAEERNICKLLEQAGARVSLEQNIARAEWRKAFVNLIVNPLCCVSNQKNEAVYQEPALRQLASQIFDEIQAVTKAENFDFSDLTLEYLLESLKPFGPNINNTLVDLRRGKQSDIEYLLGRFVAFAVQHEVAVPVSATLLQLIRFMESRKTLAGQHSVHSGPGKFSTE